MATSYDDSGHDGMNTSGDDGMNTSGDERGESTSYYEDEEDDDESFSESSSQEHSTDDMSYDVVVSIDPQQRRLRSTEQQERQRRVVDLAAMSSATTTEGENTTYFTGSYVDEEGYSTLNASSSTTRSSAPRIIQSNRPPPSPRVMDRVPGGAAAKLMLIGPKSSDSSENILRKSSTESSQPVNEYSVLNSVEEDLIRAKEEFSKGSPLTRLPDDVATPMSFKRFNDDTASMANTDVSTSTTPSFLNRNEIFFRTAAAAVAALLSQDPGTPKESESLFPASFPSSPAHYEAKPVVSPMLLSEEVERQVEEMQSRMHDPTETLTDLLKAIASPDEELTDELGYAVRRKNACGALQTLTTNEKNRVRICWTAGVLPALTSLLADGLGEEPHPNTRIRSEYEAAQVRSISTLINLATPVKNRIAVFHSPGLVRAVAKTVETKTGQARRGCAAILALLAKSPENRLLLAQVPGILEVARRVLQPRPPRIEARPSKAKQKKRYPWQDEDESSTASSSAPEETFSYDDSGTTPKQEGGGSPRELTGYDETADEMLQATRQNMFAMIGHLVKEKDNAYHFARDLEFLTTMVDISRCQESPSHTLAVKILAHLTRHRLNKVLAFKPKTVIPALVDATQSNNDDTRLLACYALQNLSQEKSCRQELAIADHLIEVLCDRCRNAVHLEERLAAISTLKNLCDEPANLIPMTNTSGCVSTLMNIADSAADSTEQYRACDALATLSHWLRKIATSGYSLDASEKGRPPMKGLFVPTLREVSWNQWN